MSPRRRLCVIGTRLHKSDPHGIHMLRRLIAIFALLTAFAAPALAQDAADAIVRLNRLEGQFRQIVRARSSSCNSRTGSSRNRSASSRKTWNSASRREAAARSPRPPHPHRAPALAPAPAQPQKRSDVFDPSSAPDAARRAAAARTTPASAAASPTAQAPGRPVPDGAVGGHRRPDRRGGDGTAARRSDLNPTGRNGLRPPPPGARRPSARSPSVAATSSGDPRAEYELAYSYLTQRQYEQAEMGFRRFLQSNPRDRLVPDASTGLAKPIFSAAASARPPSSS